MRWMFRIAVLSCLLGIAVTAAAASPARQTVSIKAMNFNPPTLTVKVGDTVRWTNDDDRDHTVVAADGSFKSGNLRSGERFEHRFDKAGRFAYACSYHPRMKGIVIVSE